MPFELLLLLVERHGQLVSRAEIAARLWKNGIHVDTESGVHTAVRKLRAALKDSIEKPIFIETVPGKGYRFIGQVSESITVAVLPFENLSSISAQDYFSDGLTEEIISSLGSLASSRIHVIARTSSMAYKRTSKTVDQIAHELGASHLVEGTVRRDRQRLRIAAKLIRAADQVQVWGDTYDQSSTDLLAIQQEIGAAIARQVGVEFSRRATQTSRRPSQDPDAHDMYLRGRYYWYRRTLESMWKAEECFQAAIQKDASFGLAYAGLADTYVIQILVNGASATQQWDKARLAAETALRLNPNLSEAHNAAAMIDFFVGWDWTAAEHSFVRAIELNPNYAIAHQFYGHLLSNSLRHDEAITEIRRAREIDPLSPIMHVFAGMFYTGAGRYDEAFACVRDALAIDPDFFPAHTALAHLHDHAGECESAIEEYRTAYRLSGGNLLQLAFRGFVLGRIGRRAEAQQIAATMNQISQSRFVPPSAFALVYTALDDRDAAFHWLEKAYEVRDIFLVSLPCGTWWDSLRSDKRFEALLCRWRT